MAMATAAAEEDPGAPVVVEYDEKEAGHEHIDGVCHMPSTCKRLDLLPEEVADEYRKAHGRVPDTAKHLQAFAKKNGWLVKYTDAVRIVKLLSSERVEIKKKVTKGTIVTEYIPTSEYEAEHEEEPEPVPRPKPTPVVRDTKTVTVRYKGRTITLDMPEGPYKLGDLRKDVICKGFLDASAQLVAFKINGRMVSKYSQDVKAMGASPIRVEIIDPSKQKAAVLGKTHDRLKREDPRAAEKLRVQREFIRKVTE